MPQSDTSPCFVVNNLDRQPSHSPSISLEFKEYIDCQISPKHANQHSREEHKHR